MTQRELIVLGTSSQVPTRYRNHNGYLLKVDGHGLLFDPGEGTQRQMLLAGVATREVTRVFVTHFHGDHCLGLPGIVQRLSLDSAPHPVEVHFPASGQVYFDRLRHASIFHDGADIRPCPIAADGQVATVPAFAVTARRLDHGADTFGYRIDEPDGKRVDPGRAAAAGLAGPQIGELLRQGTLRVGGRVHRIEEIAADRKGQSMAFVMDTRLCDAAFALARGVDLLVCESTYLAAQAREAERHGHLTARQAATIARDAGARRLVLTHFSQRYEDIDGAFRAEAQEIFPQVVVAHDGLRVPVPRRR